MRARSVAKEVVYNSMNIIGLTRLARRRLAQKLIILTYHSFREPSTDSVIGGMPIRKFEKQVRFLKRHFKILSLSEALLMLSGGDISGERDTLPKVAITVDDGFSDNYDLMFNIAKKYQIPVTVFVATDFLDNGRPPWPTQLIEILYQTNATSIEYPIKLPLNSEEEKGNANKAILGLWKGLSPEERFNRLDELRKHLGVDTSHVSRPMTWEQVRTMRKEGVKFGSHTVFHGYLPNISESLATSELRQSKLRLEEELQEPCMMFAYPNGDWDEKSRRLIIAERYQLAVTQDNGANSYGCDPYTLRRIEVPFDESLSTFACRNSLIAF